MKLNRDFDDILIDYVHGKLSEEEANEVSVLLETDESARDRLISISYLATVTRRNEQEETIRKFFTRAQVSNQHTNEFSYKSITIIAVILIIAAILFWLLFNRPISKEMPLDRGHNRTIDTLPILNTSQASVYNYIDIPTPFHPKSSHNDLYPMSILYEGIDIKTNSKIRIWLGPDYKAQSGEDIYFLDEKTCDLYVSSPNDLLTEKNREKKLPQASANSCIESYYYDGRRPKRRVLSNMELKGRKIAVRC